MNRVDVNVPGPFSAHLHPYKTTLYTSVCKSKEGENGGESCAEPSQEVLGWYEAPAMPLKAGMNHVEFHAGMKVADRFKLITDFVVPIFQEGKDQEMTIAAESVDIVAGLELAGINFQIKVASLKLSNKVKCRMVAIHDATDIPGCGVPHPNDVLESEAATVRHLAFRNASTTSTGTSTTTTLFSGSTTTTTTLFSGPSYEMYCSPMLPQPTTTMTPTTAAAATIPTFLIIPMMLPLDDDPESSAASDSTSG